IIGRVHPLVSVLMMDVMLFRPAMHDSEPRMIAEVGVMHVGRIIRIERFGGLRSGSRRASARSNARRRAWSVCRNIHVHRRIAYRPGRVDELLILRILAID